VGDDIELKILCPILEGLSEFEILGSSSIAKIFDFNAR